MIKRLLQILRRSSRLKLLMPFLYNRQSVTKICLLIYSLQMPPTLNRNFKEYKLQFNFQLMTPLALHYSGADTSMSVFLEPAVLSCVPSTVSPNVRQYYSSYFCSPSNITSMLHPNRRGSNGIQKAEEKQSSGFYFSLNKCFPWLAIECQQKLTLKLLIAD